MTLLKDDGTAPSKINSRKIIVTEWPKERLPNGLGLSVKDGFYFGIGFGVAVTIVLPIILLTIGFVIAVILAIFGGIGI